MLYPGKLFSLPKKCRDWLSSEVHLTTETLLIFLHTMILLKFLSILVGMYRSTSQPDLDDRTTILLEQLRRMGW